MSMRTTVLMLAMGVALAGCNKDTAPEAGADAPAAAPAAERGPAPVAAADPAPSPATAPAPVAAPAAAFDINTIAASDKPLGEWPYLVLPAGYEFSGKLADKTKDLARVPFWTGGQLLWVEGKTYEAELRAGDGKTYSRFELLKGIDQALTALGAVTLTERSYDETVYDSNKPELASFRSEFDDIDDAYWYDKDARTYLIRRADKAIWMVVYADNYNGAVLVAEGPLPEAPTKP
ncbi:MAG: hypothetical protein OJK14_31190 [Achromobacter sp.]|uniref:hypothetical protein n=1 Tax=Achromobacter sp. TaxID=134375 RepID=UPI002583ACFD|nr:hypothetical protein [Achromobacter sp.]MCW0211587.1 hypothetical protein [Achromobacter sp.]